MTLYDDSLATLTGWTARNAQQHELRTAYVDHLRSHPNGLSRTCTPDHLTASTLVVSADRRRILLNHHARYSIWVQFGGHCESGDQTLAAAALREAFEESGVSNLRLVSEMPVQLSTHQVSCGPLNPAHHLDVRYVAVAPDEAQIVVSAESVDVRWFSRHDLPNDVDAGLRQLIDWSQHL